VTTIGTEDPLALAAVEAIHKDDLPELKRLLAENPDLPAATLGDDQAFTRSPRRASSSGRVAAVLSRPGGSPPV
jgi:hypothetical protein